MTRGARPAAGPVGVVDIGSNSIRLVVFDAPKRAPQPVFNEKILCGLGRGLQRSGELDPDVMYGCGGDRNFLAKNGGIHPADFLRHVWASGGDDSKIVAWIKSI
jgi:hypothetical protein